MGGKLHQPAGKQHRKRDVTLHRRWRFAVGKILLIRADKPLMAATARQDQRLIHLRSSRRCYRIAVLQLAGPCVILRIASLMADGIVALAWPGLTSADLPGYLDIRVAISYVSTHVMLDLLFL
jgi:hypothetical protein